MEGEFSPLDLEDSFIIHRLHELRLSPPVSVFSLKISAILFQHEHDSLVRRYLTTESTMV
jgi:hypothetical protein